jgi:hypothetical protein
VEGINANTVNTVHYLALLPFKFERMSYFSILAVAPVLLQACRKILFFVLVVPF